MEEARTHGTFPESVNLIYFDLGLSTRNEKKQYIGILKMPPFCQVRLLTRDEHAHSFCRCVLTMTSYGIKYSTNYTPLSAVLMSLSIHSSIHCSFFQIKMDTV